MKILELISKDINQNGYNINILSKNKIGTLYILPVNNNIEDCLPCDGYVLKIAEYRHLYSVIGKQFNNNDEEAEDEFRIPDYNITGEFLQPSVTAAVKITQGLPNLTGGILSLARHAYHNNNYAIGVFYTKQATVTTHNIGNGGTTGFFDLIGFDASKSNVIYGSSTIVQPPSRTVQVFIKYR